MDASLWDKTSDDGRIQVRFALSEGRMSHWIARPRLLIKGQRRPLLDLWDESYWAWDAQATFPGKSKVNLAFRKYPGSESGFMVVIDVDAKTYQLCGGQLPEELESAFKTRLREDTSPLI